MGNSLGRIISMPTWYSDQLECLVNRSCSSGIIYPVLSYTNKDCSKFSTLFFQWTAEGQAIQGPKKTSSLEDPRLQINITRCERNDLRLCGQFIWYQFLVIGILLEPSWLYLSAYLAESQWSKKLWRRFMEKVEICPSHPLNSIRSRALMRVLLDQVDWIFHQLHTSHAHIFNGQMNAPARMQRWLFLINWPSFSVAFVKLFSSEYNNWLSLDNKGLPGVLYFLCCWD